MDEMKITKCLHCGGELLVDPRTGIPTCKYCKREYKSAVDDFSYELQEIVNRRQMREFRQAEELCAELIKKQPESSEAYWQYMLSQLGVVYVKEGRGMKPTFFSYSYSDRELIKDNINFKNAVKFAKNSEDRRFYEDKAKELDILLKEFFNLVAKENSYDIFISIKKTTVALVDGEERSIETDDYYKAKEIYNAFKDKYNVFFSPVSIGKDTGIEGEKYEPRILKALQSCKAMILLGSKTEYLEAQWVENEWKRYQYFIEKNQKKRNSLILGYIKQMPSLPSGLKDIQLPTFDMFKGNYLKELEGRLSFVETSKGLRSTLKERKVKSDFVDETEEFNFGYNVERIVIKPDANGQNIQISATEERDMQVAYNSLKNMNFKPAYLKYSAIINKNPNNAKAYIGRMCASIRAKDIGEIPSKIFNAKKADYEDLERAIEKENDVNYSWHVIDKVIESLSFETEWKNKKPVFEFLTKYVDVTRVKAVLETLAAIQLRYIINKKIAISEEIFACSRKIFFDDNLDYNIDYTEKYAQRLMDYGHFGVARKYFEELASARRSGRYYLDILRCRLETKNVENVAFTLYVNPDDDPSTKKPSELDLDEIIERIIICNEKEKDQELTETVMRIVLFQIWKNRKNARPFIETVVSCYKQFNQKKSAEEFLLKVADRYQKLRDFNAAKIYYSEILTINTNCSRAHWGLLMCRFKVDDENGLVKRRKYILNHDVVEYNNAISSATNEEFDHYSAIIDEGKQSNERNVFKTANRKKHKKALVLEAVFIAFMAAIAVVAFVAIRFGGTYWAENVLPAEVGFESFFALFAGGSVGYIACLIAMILAGLAALIAFIFAARAVVKDIDSVLGRIGGVIGFILFGGQFVIGLTAAASFLLIRLSFVLIGFLMKYLLSPYGLIIIGVAAIITLSVIAKKSKELRGLFLLNLLLIVALTTYCYVTSIATTFFANEYYEMLGSSQTYAETINAGDDKLVYQLSENDPYYFVFEPQESANYTIELHQLGNCSEKNALVRVLTNNGELLSQTKKGDDWSWILGLVKGEKYYIVTNLTKGAMGGYGVKLSACQIDYTEQLDFQLSGDTYTVSAKDSSIGGVLVIPETYNGKKVGRIGSFSGCSKIMAVEIPDGVTSISSYAFNNCSNLTSVVIPDSVTSIGDHAFYDCRKLTKIIIPDSVESIGSYAFYDCSNLTSVTISDSVESIGSYAFYNCRSLTSVTIPDSVTSIGDYAFQNCSNLTSVTIPDSVTSIGDYAFQNCSNLTSVTCPARALSYLPKSNLETVVITSGEVSPAIFDSHSQLKSVTIGDDVTGIGAYAFVYCYGLKSVEFGKNSKLQSIGEGAFGNCSELTEVVIPDGVTSLGNYAFAYCGSLESVTIPDSVTDIGEYLFSDCYYLTSLTFKGTEAQWADIEKGENWNDNIPAYYINCSDGDSEL